MRPVTGKMKWVEATLIAGIVVLSLAAVAISTTSSSRSTAVVLACLGTGHLILLSTRWRPSITARSRRERELSLIRQLDAQRGIAAAAQDTLQLSDSKISGLARELRSSLHGVVGLADALLHSELQPHQRRSVTVLLQAGEEMARVIKGIASDGLATPTYNLDAAPGALVATTTEQRQPASIAPQLAPIEPRVLLVDDVAVNRLICRTFLQKLGLTVDEAVNGQEAVEMASQVDYSVILMDVQMPVMDGYEATRQIRRRLGSRAPPILAVTANVLPKDKEMCEQCGMVAHLGKPLHLASLERLLARWIPMPTH
ncbi:MAG: CheY-like chemotaxis protein [Kiritimatiellia bacterium]|jgi:CheY-like chemotaxis protein